MMRIRAAKAANASMRRQGRTPGEEGRAAIARNRVLRKQAEEVRLIQELSAVRGPSGQLTPEQARANEMILLRAKEQEEARVEALAQEWAAKQRRLVAERPEYDLGRIGSTDMRGI